MEPVAVADSGVLNWIADKQFQHKELFYTSAQLAAAKEQARKSALVEAADAVVKTSIDDYGSLSFCADKLRAMAGEDK